MADLPQSYPVDNYNLAPQMEPQVPPETQVGLKARWDSFLSNPDNRAALFQFGISALQPIGVGQSLLGHLGQAAGMAGETVAERSQQRAEAAQVSLNRKLQLAELGLRSQDMAGDEAFRAAQLGISKEELRQRERGIDIDQQNADTALLRAERDTSPEGLTASRRLSAREKALAAWQEARANITFGGEDPGPWEDYWYNYQVQIGLDPDEENADVTSSSADSAVTGSELVAAPQTAKTIVAGPPPAPMSTNVPLDLRGGATLTAPSPAVAPIVQQMAQEVPANTTLRNAAGSVPVAGKITAEEFKAQRPTQWAQLQVMLGSPDPQMRAVGREMLGKISRFIADPDKLAVGQPMGGTVRAEPAPATQVRAKGLMQ